MQDVGLKLLTSLNDAVSGRLHQFVQRRRAAGELSILGFCGYGTPSRVFLQGRVLRPRTFGTPGAEVSRWRNLQDVMRRFHSMEVMGVHVHGTLAGVEAQCVTDSEGYFQLSFELPEPLADGWYEASLTLPSRTVESKAPVRVVSGAQFAVISDLDDTVVVSNVTRMWQMVTTVLFGNAHTRLPFPGVGALYRALIVGSDGSRNNPVFYVSSSPWNLFDVLWTFLEYRNIPLGPLFLRDWGLHTLRAKHGTHKLQAITKLFELYADLSFVLVGDSGEQDPEIYREVVHRYPGRVLAVYIRDVSEDASRDEQVQALRHELRVQDVDLVLAGDSLAAAHHAHAIGLIGSRGVRDVGESM